MNKVFDQSALRQFVRSPLSQRNQRSGLDVPHCNTIMVQATGRWDGYGPFPLWARGTYRLSHGYTVDEAILFYQKAGAAFTQTSANQFGVGQTTFGDLRFPIRYRTALWSTIGTIRTGANTVEDPYVDWPVSYTMQHRYHRYSGTLFSVIGTSGCASPYYSSTLSDAGVLTQSGDVNGWRDCPFPFAMNGQPNIFDLQYEGGYVECTITENTARFFAHVIYTDSTPIDWTFTIDLSDAMAMEDALSDTEQLLDIFDLRSLSRDYGVIQGQDTDGFLHWNVAYDISWNLQPGVPLQRVIVNGGFNSAAAAQRRVSFFAGFVLLSKTRSGTSRLTTALYSEEQTLPEPSTSYSPDTGHNGEFPAQTDCANPYTAGQSEVYLEIGDIPFALGQSTLQRTCAGNVLCTP